MTSAIVRNQFEHPNDSLQWIILLFSYIKCFLWNNVKPRRVLEAYLKICPPPSAVVKSFDHWIGVLINTRAPSYLVEQCRVTSWPCPYSGLIFSDCTVTQWKIKMQTIQYKKSRIWEMKEDKYTKSLAKNPSVQYFKCEIFGKKVYVNL